MKKITLSLLFLIVCCTSASAKFGIRGGLNLSNAVAENYDGNMKTSFYAGITKEFSLSNFFSLSPEIVYTRDGSKAKYDGVITTYRNNYIMVPLLAKLKVSKKFILEAGPQLGILLNASDRIEGETYDRDSANSVQALAAFGVTYMFNRSVGIQGRYVLGISNMGKLLESQSRGVQFGLVFSL